MNIQFDEIQGIITQKYKSSPRGRDCTFIPLTEKWGLKLFNHKETRDLSYDRQKKCLEIGLAPEIGDKIDLPDDQYGYITEIVWCFPNIDTINDENRYLETHSISELDELKDEIEKFQDSFEENGLVEIIKNIYDLTGWNFYDDHVFNWGKKDGKWIPIDFG